MDLKPIVISRAGSNPVADFSFLFLFLLVLPLSRWYYIIKIKIRSSCEIEDFVVLYIAPLVREPSSIETQCICPCGKKLNVIFARPPEDYT